ncbi:hypothetical protein LTR09_012578 [Extremus antarcticus]|uniref:Uncharacterized protein n=1 Tax=Extremus antarcticus TaxID=702011 RepID=A0AAJ0G969_9PEZI|nr:hypothetical protein LTR09_012578 [Extremus antarcticus]
MGWSGLLPASDASRRLLVNAYNTVAPAFSNLDRLADPRTGGWSKLPTRLEDPAAGPDNTTADLRIMR